MSRKLKNIFLIVWATAVFGICASSLINFHQHKIWGKPLLPQLLYAKRDKEKSIDLLKSFNSNQTTIDFRNTIHPLAFTSDLPQTIDCGVDIIYFDPGDIPLPHSAHFSFRALRAPPVA